MKYEGSLFLSKKLLASSKPLFVFTYSSLISSRVF